MAYHILNMLHVIYGLDTTNKTLLENDSCCSENTQANIAKNLFWDKKQPLLFLRFDN